MSGALEYSQYRIDDIVERIEKEIERATCERPPLVTERGVCVKRKFGKGHYATPPWLLGFRSFESAETYFKERGYQELERTTENGERKLVMYDHILDETYEITTYTREHYPPDEDGNEPFYRDYTEETLRELRRGIASIKRANAYLRCIDELIDYDYNEETFHKRLKKELLKLRIEEKEKMAIEIIKEGKKLNPKYQGMCNHCECVFSFQEEDIMIKESWRNELYAKILCPHCGKICSIGMDGVKVIEE